MKFVPQYDLMDCGPACLAMVSNAYGKQFSVQFLRNKSYLTKSGTSLLGIREAAAAIGFDTKSTKLTLEELHNNFSPCIIHWNQNHYVVLYDLQKGLFNNKITYKVADPAIGKLSLNKEEFIKAWVSNANHGISLFLRPTEKFYATKETIHAASFSFLLKYLKPFKLQFLYLVILMLFAAGITIILPFLTQYLIDTGIAKKDFTAINLIVTGQIVLYLSSLLSGVFRNWLILKVGTAVNISIISDYIKSLLLLPVKYFETKMMGDFHQRIQDNQRIESFLTSQGLLAFFSIIILSAFLAVLWSYSFIIFFLYIFSTALSIAWSLLFLKKRKYLDYARFQHRSENQNSIYEIFNGITEMKLNQLEEYKRGIWEKTQASLFKVSLRLLKLDQIQVFGFDFINQLKNILVTFLAAKQVIGETMSLGEMLSISFIIGQLNSPINQLISFIKSSQDAKISLERLNEIQYEDIEDPLSTRKAVTEVFPSETAVFENKPLKKGILLANISFRYGAPDSPLVLKNINLFIPKGKITAIVGPSGSGKTTLMKLLLRFYAPSTGEIYINDQNIDGIATKDLRRNFGVVMQDGYIFSDTIERNIATSDIAVDPLKFDHAVQVANIKEYIDSLPIHKETKIGATGNGISGGQRQRILIARAVYKDPEFIFFDEATSALDAENERIIHDNLHSFFYGKTVLIIAHRLSTVKNADQVVVLKDGEIVETGSHLDLVRNRSAYFNLVKNQLELGS